MSNKTNIKGLPLRSEIKVEDTWKLEDIFESNELWEKEFEEVKNALPGLVELQGKLSESAASLYEVLKHQDEITYG